jgi:hypothetical protein
VSTVDEVFTHEAILERLDWTQIENGQQHYYPPSEFENNVNTFDQISVYYGDKHPRPFYPSEEELLKNEKVIKVGYVSNPNVNRMGRPKLKAFLNITDPVIEEKIRQGEILLSPQFGYKPQKDGDKINLTSPRGLHVLLFDKNLGVPQGDPGAIICNNATSENEEICNSLGYFSGGDTITEEATIQVLKVSDIAELFKANQAPVLDLTKHDELVKANQALETEKDELVKANQALTTEIDNLKKQITETKEKLETERVETFKNNQDRFWNDLIESAKEKFAERKEAELYDVVKSNQLVQDITRFIMSIPTPEFSKAEGNTEVKENQETPENDYKTLDAEYNAALGRA